MEFSRCLLFLALMLTALPEFREGEWLSAACRFCARYGHCRCVRVQVFDPSVLCVLPSGVTLTALPEEAGDNYQDRVVFVDSE